MCVLEELHRKLLTVFKTVTVPFILFGLIYPQHVAARLSNLASKRPRSNSLASAERAAETIGRINIYALSLHVPWWEVSLITIRQHSALHINFLRFLDLTTPQI